MPRSCQVVWWHAVVVMEVPVVPSRRFFYHTLLFKPSKLGGFFVDLDGFCTIYSPCTQKMLETEYRNSWILFRGEMCWGWCWRVLAFRTLLWRIMTATLDLYGEMKSASQMPTTKEKSTSNGASLHKKRQFWNKFVPLHLPTVTMNMSYLLQSQDQPGD